jgi:hypothetical protein
MVGVIVWLTRQDLPAGGGTVTIPTEYYPC